MRVADLFSGCGGLSAGLQAADFKVVIAVEHWNAARKVYARNFDHPVLDLDISGVNEVVGHLRPFEIDLIAGGPPCQDFSAAGARSEGARARLTVSFASIIAELRPTWFLLENVPQAQSSVAWGSAKKMLARAGYGISECVLNAAYFDVPQTRKRFFAIGRLSEDDHFLDSLLEERRRATPMTVREHLGDRLGVPFYYRHPRNWGRKAIYSVDEPSATIRSTNRPVPPGYSEHPSDAGPYQNARPLTAQERALIQTFPANFIFSGFAYEQDMMIANAVPVALARHVGEAIMTYENRRNQLPADLRFRSWLVSHSGMTDRSAGNVVSRLRRICKILKVKQVPHETESSLASLRRRGDFKSMSTSVKSQLKRALTLYGEFKSATTSAMQS